MNMNTDIMYSDGFPKNVRSRTAMLKKGTAKKMKCQLEEECKRLAAVNEGDQYLEEAETYINNVLHKEISILEIFLERKRKQSRRIIRLDPRNVSYSSLTNEALHELQKSAKELYHLCIEETNSRNQNEGFSQEEICFHLKLLKNVILNCDDDDNRLRSTTLQYFNKKKTESILNYLINANSTCDSTDMNVITTTTAATTAANDIDINVNVVTPAAAVSDDNVSNVVVSSATNNTTTTIPAVDVDVDVVDMNGTHDNDNNVSDAKNDISTWLKSWWN